MAIRLAPADGDSVLGGALDPLHLTFASDRLVYPMRLSKLARTEQHLRLYVLAAHRMEPRSTIGGGTPKVTYAGPIPAKSGGPLPEFAGGERYLTALTQDFPSRRASTTTTSCGAPRATPRTAPSCGTTNSSPPGASRYGCSPFRCP